MPLFRRNLQNSSTAQVEDDPHSWQLPSSYPSPRPGEKKTAIPKPSIFANVSSTTKLDTDSYPDVGHAATHLALLECFQNMRQSVTAIDFGFQPPPDYNAKAESRATPSQGASQPQESQNWDLLIRVAIDRFSAWWSNINVVLIHASAYRPNTRNRQLSREYLPPLDVLLVWYAFMLDTENYQNACRSLEPDIPKLSELHFPWAAVRDVIDMEKMQFFLPRSAQNLFFTLSKQSTDILTYLQKPPPYIDETGGPVFAVDLFAEVKKQERFIEEAHNLLWIRGPSLEGSLMRAAKDYFSYCKRQPTRNNAMDLDMHFGIELFWRTHRLVPNVYEHFEQRPNVNESHKEIEARQNPVFNDLAKEGLDAARPRYCCCWTCERIRDDLPNFIRFRPDNLLKQAEAQLSSLSQDQLNQIRDDLGFYTAVEEARKRGHTLPTRLPTRAELEAKRIAKTRQDNVGYLPGVNEWVEVQPNGTRKIRRHKFSTGWSKWFL